VGTNRNRELQEAIEECLTTLGATQIAFGTGGKHQYVECLLRGLRITHHYTTTPSDHRYVKNTVRDLKRQVRERLDMAARPR